MKKNILKKLYCLLLSFFLSFLCGYFITSIVNQENSYYQCNFIYNGNKNLQEIINKEYIEEIKNTDLNKYQSVDSSQLLKNKNLSIVQISSNEYVLKTKAKYYDNFFFVSKNTIGTRAKTFIKLLLTSYCEDNSLNFIDNENIVFLTNYFSSYIGGGIALLIGIVIFSPIIIIYKIKDTSLDYDNVNIFKSIFHLNFWKHPFENLKDIKKITALAMIFSMLLVSKLIHLPSGFGNLGIGLGYIFLAIIGVIYGPYISVIIGALSDILGYFIGSKSGIFYLGYTLQACLASLTYALCFYKQRITFSKVLFSRLIVNLLLNVLLGSYLQCIIFVKGGLLTKEYFKNTFISYALLFSLPKNLLYLLPQSIVLYLILKELLPILSRFNLINNELVKDISLI